MRKRKIIVVVTAIVVSLSVCSLVWASNNAHSECNEYEVPAEIQALEKKAEDGETAALHRVIDFYSDKYASACIVDNPKWK